MILCVPLSNSNSAGLGGCPNGYGAVTVGQGADFQALQLQETGACVGMLCDMPVQDVGFAALIVICFAVGFAAGFVRR